MRDRRAWLLAATAIAAIYAIAVALTGGFSLRIAGLHLRSHSWVRPALLAIAGTLLLAVGARARIAALCLGASRVLESPRLAIGLVICAIAWVLAAGVWFGTFAIGGADSYGYVGQARLLAHARLTDTVPFSADYTRPDVEATLTPLGFTIGQTPGVIAPKYPPGLPLLLAPLAARSETLVYWIVPVFGQCFRAAQHSGSIRYCSSRPTLRWDLLSPTRLDQVLATFRAQGYEPLLVVDVGEYKEFQERFEATDQRALRGMTPLAVLGDALVFGFR